MASPRRIIAGALAAAALLAAFLVTAQRVAPAGPATRSAATSSPLVQLASPGADGPGFVVRTAPNLRGPGDADQVADRLRAQGAERAWVQVKQDENEEHPSGTLFYPSALAPVAAGHHDGRVQALVGALAARGVTPLAWMPVLHDAQAAAAHPQWRSQRITEDGALEVDPDWLCPFHPEVRRYQADIAAEVASVLPVGGLYLDFVRYDDDFTCACPDCLAELDARAGWSRRTGAALTPGDLRRASSPQAATAQRELWAAWHALRADQITATVTEIREAVHRVRPGLPVGAFVLPFNAAGYEDNTQSGQDLDRLAARAGLSELVLMGYWDDWGHDPAWVREQLDAAARVVSGRVPVSVVLDGDMGVRSTRLTLQALGPWERSASWFHFDAWTQAELGRLARAVDGHRSQGPMPPPEYVSVVIRVDTEPDDQPSYDAVHPEMIDTLLELFAEEDVSATFMTVGRLAELQGEAVRRAAAAGHEIGSHSYDHEQIDALPLTEQLAAVDKGLATLRRLGFTVHGFGAPRNSITDEARDRLMAWGLEYDGSAAYDPMTGLLDVRYAVRSDLPGATGAGTSPDGDGERIVVVPFVIPNDWDARVVLGMTAEEMAAAWIERLDRVVDSGEPVFVLDVHQWSASAPDNLEALRRFIRYTKECDRCRVQTLRDAARHARSVLDRYETP